jgi:poly-gamma-glutamate synthesis protein (capsule biosynthesis protein)
MTRTPFLPVTDSPDPVQDTAFPVVDTFTSTPLPLETTTSLPTSTPTPNLTVNLDAVGDIMLARTVGQQVHAQGPQVVFAGVQPVLNTADVLVGNLECALTIENDPQHKSYTFAAPPETAQALALAGFDVLSLANNHAMDYGISGLSDTRNSLNQYGIASVGAGVNASDAHTPVILERNGLRMAFLAYADVPVENDGFDARTWIASDTQPGIAWADLNQIATGVSAARNEADVVIVLLHSGYELNSAVSTNQRAEAHAAIDAGAALVIGSHSHILQPIERYHGGLIAYSLGNFVFDDYLGIVNATIILRVVLTGAGFQSYDWVPVLIQNGMPILTNLNNVEAIGTMVAPINP